MSKPWILIVVFAIVAPLCAYLSEATTFIHTVKAFSHHPLLDAFNHTSCVVLEGPDAELRPVVVNLQADFERALVHGLKSKSIARSLCIIHTPAPATPLCTEGEISEGLVDPAILNDPERLLTVKKRPDILRDYLQEGGLLWSAYPQNGRKLRSQEQLAILERLVEMHPDHLTLLELDCTEIPQELIGATYVITFAEGTQCGLSFRSYQANAPTDGKWAIWFGPIEDPAILMRVQEVETWISRQIL